MPPTDRSTSRTRVVVVWAVGACIVAVPLCLIVVLLAILIFLYGVGVLWEGVPDASHRGPGDGFFMLLVPPLALVLWLVSVGVVCEVAARRRARVTGRAPARDTA